MNMVSMTGYGAYQKEDGQFAVEVILQSFNSKGLDIRENVPIAFGDRSVAWRKLIASKLLRGRIVLVVQCRFSDVKAQFKGREETFIAYYDYLTALANEVGAKTDTFAQSMELFLSHTPKATVQASHQKMADEALQEAIDQLVASRAKEGAYLATQLETAIDSMREDLEAIVAKAPLRTEALRKRLEQKIQTREGALDSQRWEQEVLYYLEKMDIEEECVRLKGHIVYFLDTMQKEPPIGKELIFIIEEMRRELNAILSKAQTLSLQHLAVQMKKTLEQIKEQLANVL